MTIAEVSGFEFDTPAEMWTARMGRQYENARGGIMSAHDARLEALNAVPVHREADALESCRLLNDA